MTDPFLLISSMATRHVLAELIAAYRTADGRPVNLKAMGGVPAAQTVREGAVLDVVVLASRPMAELEAAGHLVAGSRRLFARSPMALGLPAGDATPAPTTVDELKVILRRAGRIGFSTGPSGDHVKALWKEWGFDHEPSVALMQAPAGIPVAQLIADGTVRAGIQQLSELLDQPGVRVVGPVPDEAQLVTDFVCGVAASSKAPEAAHAFCQWLAAPNHTATLNRHGML